MGSMHVRAVATLTALSIGAMAGMSVLGSPARAAPGGAAIPPTMACDALAKLDLTRVDAKINSAAMIREAITLSVT